MAAQILRSYQVEMSTAVEQNGKGQDLAISGTTVSGKEYIAVFDGHASDSVINALRAMQAVGDFTTIMDSDCPVELVQQILIEDDVCSDGKSSGSTMTGAVLDGNELRIFNCGDSRTFVFRNGVLEYATEEHCPGNPDDRARSTHDFIPDARLRAISETTLEQIPAEYAVIRPVGRPSYRIAATRALGHDGHLNPTGDLHTFVIEPTDEIVVVSVSDGVTDMLICDENDRNAIRAEDIRMLYELSVEELTNKIQERWGQPWTGISISGKISNLQWTKGEWDDVGIARMVIRSK